MSVYKSIDQSNVSITETHVYKTQTLHSGSDGIKSIQYRSGSVVAGSNGLSDVSGSYWESLRVLFYLSGSLEGTGSNAQRYNESPASLANWTSTNPQRVNKFYISGSVISIPQKYFGETIKPTSFILTDNSHASGTITIKDDGYGNLYPVGNADSQSVSSPSSSDNYVGNIFYNHGIVTITDTGSYSGSTATDAIKYTDVTTDKYTLEFKSTQTIYTHEYTVVIKPHEFNYTMNPTVRGWLSGAAHDNLFLSPYMKPKFTASGWSAYANQIQLYSSKNWIWDSNSTPQTREDRLIRLTEPVILANLPRPIKMRDDMDMIFKIRIDL